MKGKMSHASPQGSNGPQKRDGAQPDCKNLSRGRSTAGRKKQKKKTRDEGSKLRGVRDLSREIKKDKKKAAWSLRNISRQKHLRRLEGNYLRWKGRTQRGKRCRQIKGFISA